MTDQQQHPDEAHRAEVVPIGGGAPPDPRNTALQAAADAAVAMPGIPGRDEFLALAMQARILSMSGAAPKAVRDNPYIAFHVAMVGRDLGISPSAALALIDVIDTKQGPQLSLSPQLLNGQIDRLGLGKITPAVRTDERCVAVALAPGGAIDHRCRATWPDHHDQCTCRGILGESEFTWADAQMAGLAGEKCTPGHHVKVTRQGRSGGSYEACGCSTGYISYPKRMMWWRASGFAADDYFPQAGLGLYSPEELGAVVDPDGRPVDPANVELPPGYEKEAPPAAPVADPEALMDLRIRIRALPDEDRHVLLERWKDKDRPLPPLVIDGALNEAFPAGSMRRAEAMVRGVEAQARAKGWDQEAARSASAAALTADAEPTTDPDAPPDPDDDPPPAARPDEPSPQEPTAPTSDGQAGDEPATTPADTPEPSTGRTAPASPADDAALGEVRDLVHRLVAGAGGEQVERVAGTVKVMHHAHVDAGLREVGWDPTGHHIDIRRMLLTATLVRRENHPNECISLGCENQRREDTGDPSDAEDAFRYCLDHGPF